jgi:hypothetical protein
MNINYLHHFAYWAAARAVHNPNNPGIKTKQVKAAIEKIGLYHLIQQPKELKNVEKKHNELANKLIKELKLAKHHFGLAAKIIAIYLKVTVIIPQRASEDILKNIYPPIDAKNLHKINGFKNSKWTSLTEKEFDKAILELKTQLKKSNSTFIEFEAENELTT